MISDLASDYSKTDNQARLFAAPLPVDASAEPATDRYSPRAALIVVSLLSLGIWAAIWALLGSLLWG